MARMVANVGISVNGTPLSPMILKDVQSISVNDDLRMSGTFNIRMNTWDARLQQVTWADSPQFAIGTSVDIQLGYVGAPLQTVMYGDITDLEVQYSDREPPVLSITGYDVRHRLARSTQYQPYKGDTDSSVVQKVLSASKLGSQVTPTSVIYASTTQNNETSLAFLNRLAWRNKFDLTPNRQVIRFGPPSIFGPAITLMMDRDLNSFNVGVAGSVNVDAINLCGKATSNGKDFSVSSKVGAFPGTLSFDKIESKPSLVTDVAVTTQDEAQAIADAKAYDAGADRVNGSGSGYGNNSLRAGVTITIPQLGNRFSGSSRPVSYRVMNVTHSYVAESGYTTSFRVRGAPQ